MNVHKSFVVTCIASTNNYGEQPTRVTFQPSFSNIFIVVITFALVISALDSPPDLIIKLIYLAVHFYMSAKISFVAAFLKYIYKG